ncbi:hypothetical protein ACIRTB_11155 [Streptomyces sp. NPDC101158]|uniref:hypothetical protein n=1 Tax=Streptomyces sp. NPDC101158 TaxID=3366117 RepID=UPI0038143E00
MNDDRVETDFELLDVCLHTEELGRVEVPLGDTEGREPLVLPEGSVVSLGLTFRLGREIDGLAFEDTREWGGSVLGSTRTVLGGFRPGGPYEVRLPPERLPVGRAHCGVYKATGRFTDADGRELAVEHHRLVVEHQQAPPSAPWTRHQPTQSAPVRGAHAVPPSAAA